MEKSRAIELLEYLRQDRNLEGTIYGDALNMAIEALKAQLSKEGTTKDATSELPTIQPEPQEGHWIPHESLDGDVQYECSQCGVLWEFNDGTPEDNEAFYCPKCGADMRGERE